MINLLKECGKGWLGPMWRGELSGEPVRVMELPGVSFSLRLDLSRRQVVSSDLSSPFLLQSHGIMQIEGRAHWVGEWVDGISLSSLLAKNKSREEVVIAALGAQLIEALAAIHQQGIVHGDLGPEQIHVEKDGTIRFDGFGRHPSPAASPRTTSKNYISIEGGSSIPGDFYSIGVMLSELLLGRSLSLEKKTDLGHQNERRALINELTNKYSSSLSSLLSNILDESPADRPGAGIVYQGFIDICGGNHQEILQEFINSEKALEPEILELESKQTVAMETVGNPNFSFDTDSQEEQIKGVDTYFGTAEDLFETPEMPEPPPLRVASPPKPPVPAPPPPPISAPVEESPAFSIELDASSHEDFPSFEPEESLDPVSSFFGAEDELSQESKEESAPANLDSFVEESPSVVSALDELPSPPQQELEETPDPGASFFTYEEPADFDEGPMETVEIETTAGWRKPALMVFGVTAALLLLWVVVKTFGGVNETPESEEAQVRSLRPTLDEADNGAKAGQEQPTGPAEEAATASENEGDSVDAQAAPEDGGEAAVETVSSETVASNSATEKPSPPAAEVKKQALQQKKQEVKKISEKQSKKEKKKQVQAKKKEAKKPTPAVSKPELTTLPKSTSKKPPVKLNWGETDWGAPTTGSAKSATAENNEEKTPKVSEKGSIKVKGKGIITLTKGGKRFNPGKLPTGLYKVSYQYPGGTRKQLGYIKLKGGQVRTVRCNDDTQTCRL